MMTERRLCAVSIRGSVGSCAIDFAKGSRIPFPDGFGAHLMRSWRATKRFDRTGPEASRPIQVSDMQE